MKSSPFAIEEWPEQNHVLELYQWLPFSSSKVSVGRCGMLSGVSSTPTAGNGCPSGVGTNDAALTRSPALPNSMMRTSAIGVPFGPSVPGGRSVAWTGANNERVVTESGVTRTSAGWLAAGAQMSKTGARGIVASDGSGGHVCAKPGAVGSVIRPTTTAAMTAGRRIAKSRFMSGSLRNRVHNPSTIAGETRRQRDLRRRLFTPIVVSQPWTTALEYPDSE